METQNTLYVILYHGLKIVHHAPKFVQFFTLHNSLRSTASLLENMTLI